MQAPVRVDIVRPGTYRAVVEHLRRTQQEHGVGYYHIMHFDVHGAVLTHTQLAQLGQPERADVPGAVDRPLCPA